eukprot:scaffold116712_cov19-Prasinocladus_malaysianus.AAC.1
MTGRHGSVSNQPCYQCQMGAAQLNLGPVLSRSISNSPLGGEVMSVSNAGIPKKKTVEAMECDRIDGIHGIYDYGARMTTPLPRTMGDMGPGLPCGRHRCYITYQM